MRPSQLRVAFRHLYVRVPEDLRKLVLTETLDSRSRETLEYYRVSTAQEDEAPGGTYRSTADADDRQPVETDRGGAALSIEMMPQTLASSNLSKG
jgi:hypothetical protein